MKKIITAALILICSFAALQGKAQMQTKETPTGFWVIEGNIKSPKESTVYFYTSSGLMVYKEQVSGVRLKANRKKTVRKLNSVLQEALVAWQNDQWLKENGQLVKSKRK